MRGVRGVLSTCLKKGWDKDFDFWPKKQGPFKKMMTQLETYAFTDNDF